MSTITVKNKLEIRPGNVIQVPGCEPISSLTSTGLLKNIDCAASIIPLEDALAIIPGSRVVRTFVPAGQNGTGMFFELPAGPPPGAFDCDCRVTDYYALLRENASVREPSESTFPQGPCSAADNWSGCVVQQPNKLRMARDPSLRPNSTPINGSPEPVGGPALPQPLTDVDRQGRTEIIQL